jgi:hypothetical protein
MGQPEPIHVTHEKWQTLWLLAASPAIWSLYFLASYITAAIWCAKFAGPDSSLNVARLAIAIYTVLALLGIGLIFLIGYRKHTHGGVTAPHDADTPEDRHRFLGLATVLLAGLSAVATIYVALAAVFIGSCN